MALARTSPNLRGSALSGDTAHQQHYAIDNPQRFRDVGAKEWGVTACDGPGERTRTIDGIRRVFFDYVARGVPDGPDDGTLAPWAVVAALPFAPEIVAPTVTHLARLHLTTSDPYGFKASYNRTFVTKETPHGWVSPYHFGINEGPTVLMIENHRSGFVWNLMRRCPTLKRGLVAAGFAGGWLTAA